MKEQWQELKETITEMRDSGGTLTQQEVCKFLVNYMKILEKQMQEPVIDKIRAEIMQLDYDLESVDYDYNDMTRTEEIHMICREEVLQIIDKYKAESEE